MFSVSKIAKGLGAALVLIPLAACSGEPGLNDIRAAIKNNDQVMTMLQTTLYAEAQLLGTMGDDASEIVDRMQIEKGQCYAATNGSGYLCDVRTARAPSCGGDDSEYYATTDATEDGVEAPTTPAPVAACGGKPVFGPWGRGRFLHRQWRLAIRAAAAGLISKPEEYANEDREISRPGGHDVHEPACVGRRSDRPAPDHRHPGIGRVRAEHP